MGCDALSTRIARLLTTLPSYLLYLSPDLPQANRLRGFAGLSPTGGDAAQAAVRESFFDRLRAFSSTVLGDSWCSNATDDDGRKLWQSLESCIWAGEESTADFYAPLCVTANRTLFSSAHTNPNPNSNSNPNPNPNSNPNSNPNPNPNPNLGVLVAALLEEARLVTLNAHLARVRVRVSSP